MSPVNRGFAWVNGEKRRDNLCGDGILVTSYEFWNAANCRSGLEFLLNKGLGMVRQFAAL
ncbi:hypothetical protein [Nitrosomonas sp.]|uniref:hypothetical protein n=1 Tax=Nitrosomonas sp. TaxID=42353 RepID=UPI0032EFF94A